MHRLGNGPSVAERIREGTKFQACPGCGVLVEHDGGCNIMCHREFRRGHLECLTEWCWLCGGVGTCSHWHCAARDVVEGAAAVEGASETHRCEGLGAGF